VGSDKAVSWPTGIAGKGNEGVAAYVKQVPGAIGYVEYAYAIENKINYVALRNQAGKIVKPSIDTFQAAAANADWQNAPGFYLVLTDQPGDKSWPITGASFILIYRQTADATRTREMLKFFDWCLRNGGDTAKGLHYVPLPANVIKLVEDLWTKEIKAGGKPLWP
jgi:phosphate transport system substrate-binding protein